MKGVLLFNPINVVHDRQIDLFMRYLTGWEIRCIYNPALPWFSAKPRHEGREVVWFRNRRPPASVFDGVRGIVMFTGQPRVEPCGLIEKAMLRSIPVMIIEEVHQMALEQGDVNNYVLPVDRLFAASEYERGEFVKAGVPECVVEATGCPLGFRYGRRSSPEDKRMLKARLGLSENKRTALLSLRYITPNGETAEIRDATIGVVSRSLPEGYELLVKPHPGEQDREIAKKVRLVSKAAVVTDPRIPIDELLDVSDVLFDRGNSQAVFDALWKGLPVIVVPMGKRTIFHGIADDIIAENEYGISRAFDAIKKNGMDIYRQVFERYLNISPEDALKRTMSRIDEAARRNELYDRDEKILLIALFWAWMGYDIQGRRVMRSLDRRRPKIDRIADSIESLVSMSATQDDLNILRQWTGDGFGQWLLASMWIKESFFSGRGIRKDDEEWLEDFPPKMNNSHFANYNRMLGAMRGDSAPWRVKLDLGVKTAAKSLAWEFSRFS